MSVTNKIGRRGRRPARRRGRGPGPEGREGHSTVYDSERADLVLFGGWRRGDGRLGDTWEWDGVRWAQVAAEGDGGPSARVYHAMAYDAARGVTVLFGGYDGADFLGDTWTWNGVQWAQVTWAWDGVRWARVAAEGEGGPSARRGHAMAYDAAREVIVLFGGRGVDGLLGDTWWWDGERWTEVTKERSTSMSVLPG